MHEAAGAPPQLTDGACAAAQSTGAAALRRILQARPLALRVHRERAIVDKSTDLWAADLHVGRAQRKDNRGPRMLARMRTRRASCRPGGDRPSSSPERPCPGSGIIAIKGGVFSVRPLRLGLLCYLFSWGYIADLSMVPRLRRGRLASRALRPPLYLARSKKDTWQFPCSKRLRFGGSDLITQIPRLDRSSSQTLSAVHLRVCS